MADQASEGLLSPWLRKKRIAASLPYLRGSVLDFGCGSGALAAKIAVDKYLGVEIDPFSLQQAQGSYSKHRFVSSLPEPSNKFDTVISLAVIEHVSDPVDFLKNLAIYLGDSASSRLIITTPHPSVDWVHDFGAAIGLFSKHASEEHEDLLDRTKLETAGKKAGLTLVNYSRFLFGANQVAVYVKGGL